MDLIFLKNVNVTHLQMPQETTITTVSSYYNNGSDVLYRMDFMGKLDMYYAHGSLSAIAAWELSRDLKKWEPLYQIAPIVSSTLPAELATISSEIPQQTIAYVARATLMMFEDHLKYRVPITGETLARRAKTMSRRQKWEVVEMIRSGLWYVSLLEQQLVPSDPAPRFYWL